MILEILATILILIADWQLFKKMGREGWEGIIPLYNNYVLCEEMYYSGWKFLLMFIPLYNIYFIFKLNRDWVQSFHKSTGFAIGMIFLPFIFHVILAFDSNAVYLDGKHANKTPDFIDKIVSVPSFSGTQESSLDKIEKLSKMKDEGILTQEEFDKKKAELLNSI